MEGYVNKRLMNDFLTELVSISSETKDLAGVLEVQKKIFEKLKSLGAEVEWIEPEVSGYAPGVFAVWGDGAVLPGVCLVSHADTVYPAEYLRSYSYSEESGLIHGSGVADNKGGLVVGLSALEKFLKKNEVEALRRPLYFFSSSCEEVGSPSFQKFIRQLSTRLEYVLGLEPALPDGSLIKKRRGNRYYSITITGNSVHTGRDLKEAANPVAGLVLLYELVEKLKERHPLVNVSVNGVRGYPFKFNMSCEKIEVNIDTRFEKTADIRVFHEEFSHAVKKLSFESQDSVNKGAFYVEIVDDCPAFDAGIIPKEFVAIAQKYSDAEKREVFLGDGLGASDCCYFYRDGLKILDGLGPRGGKIHSNEEFAVATSLDTRATALANAIELLVL